MATSARPLLVASSDPAPRPRSAQDIAQSEIIALVRTGRRLGRRSRTLLVVEIQQLGRLVEVTPHDAPDRSKLVRRLAEAYVELEAASAREGDDRSAAAASAQAVKMYRSLLDGVAGACSGPGTATGCEDEVLYFLGYELEQAAVYSDARKAYLDLVTRAPESRYAPYAYFAFGEMFRRDALRDPSRLALAEQAYTQAIGTVQQDDSLWALAVLRRGQVYAGRGERQRAQTELRRALDYGKQHAAARGATEIGRLAREEIVTSFVATGDPQQAHAFFRSIADDDVGLRDVLQALARAYDAQGKASDADVVRRTIPN